MAAPDSAPDQQRTFRFAPDVVLQVIDREALVLKLHDEDVFSLNETGARIAQLISTGGSVGSVIDTLVGEYGADRDEIARDVASLIQALLHRKLLE